MASELCYTDVSLEDFVQQLCDQLTAPDVPLFGFFELLHSNHINFQAVVNLFNKIGSTGYIDELRNRFNPRIEQITFERQVQYKLYENLLREEVPNHFRRTQSRFVFIPTPNDYYSLQLCVKLHGDNFYVIKVHEDENYKPREDGRVLRERLAGRLYVRPYECFPELENDTIYYFDSLDEVLSKY